MGYTHTAADMRGQAVILGRFPAVPPRWVWRASFLLLGVVLLIVHLRFSAHFPKTSDQASDFRAGLDIWQGNWRLRHWHLVADHFLTWDIAISATLASVSAILGHPTDNPHILIIQPAISWTILVLLAVLLACAAQSRPGARLAAASIVLALLGLPLMRETVAYFITLSAIHVGTLIYCLAAFKLADAASIRPASGWREAAMTVCILLAQIGDPMTLFILWLPLCTAVALDATQRVRRRLLVIGSASAAIFLARSLLAWNAASGGFQYEILPMMFAPFASVGQNALLCAHGLLMLFSADFTGRSLMDAVPELLHLPLFALCLAAIASTLISIRSMQPRLLDAALACGACVDLLALLLSNRAETEGFSIAAARYLFPFWIYGTILLARREFLRRIAAGFSVICLVVSLVIDAQFFAPAEGGVLWPPQAAVMRALLAQNLRLGVGSYWASALISVASAGQLTVLPMAKFGDGKLHSDLHFHRNFTTPDPHKDDMFVIAGPPDSSFTEADALAAYGPPVTREQLEPFVLLFYQHHGDFRKPKQ